MTTGQAAEALHISRIEVWRRVVSGELPSYRIGNRYRIEPAVVELARQSPGVPVRVV